MDLSNFESLQIGLASPEKIREWSHGEVTKPETINYRTLKPEPDGLFCEKIFGPTKDWECHCGKFKRIRFKGIVCDKCGVEVTKSKVRRERMGSIELATPVSHIWYFKGVPSRIGVMLDLTPRNLEKVLYFAAYIVTDPGDTPLMYKEILSEQQYRERRDEFGDRFKAGMGAEAIRQLLSEIDLEKLASELRDIVNTSQGQKMTKAERRLEAVNAFIQSNQRPEWMILDVIPVIPPELRPMVQLDGGRFATSDLNDLYRRVINRNNRLKKLLELGAPDIIVRNEKRMLQESVDALIDNGRRGRPVLGPGQRELKSLSAMLKGKQGRFRQNLLGKRVDYSGRSVIVVGPELKFYQCGLPKKMALELFKPFIMRNLVARDDAQNIKSAKRMVEKVDPKVWDVLDEVIKDHPVLLNRAPTLHRLGIQAFEPVLVEGKAIKLHPLACTAFNADFDGDQMAVHVPLSVEAQAEARFLMLSVNNILAPKDGSPITTPTQDMILGSYYLTNPGICAKYDEDGNIVSERMDEFNDLKEAKKNAADGYKRIPEKGDGKIFCDEAEMLMAYQTGAISIHAKIKVRVKKSEDDPGKLVESTPGRFIFNSEIPQDLGFVDRSADPYTPEVSFLVKKGDLTKIIDKCFRAHGNTETVNMLDHIKSNGYKYSTKAATTISVEDMLIPAEKTEIIAKAQDKVDALQTYYKRGLLSNNERYDKVLKIWQDATDEVGKVLMDRLPVDNNIKIMADSGARGSQKQIQQIGGMRGLMANATGKTIEVPIKANFREGLSVMEYFLSSNGARKGLADTALRTANSGYLTRRLVDVSHTVIIRELDCGTTEGIEVRALKDDKTDVESLEQRIVGRTSLHDIKDPATGELIVAANEEIKEAAAKKIESCGIESVAIRSAVTCKCEHGLCAKCYGRNLATGEHVNVGEAVGIIAAQSIGEPGTQLTMRTFHTGGVSTAGKDITQGLPRVEELFEARRPKGVAEICEEDGTVVSIDEREDKRLVITIRAEDGSERQYPLPHDSEPIVKEGDFVPAGNGLTKGPLDPNDILRIKGITGVFQYLIKEVQMVYRIQGVDISDKHIEVIVSQMLNKCHVTDCGDTTLPQGGIITRKELERANEALAEGQTPATAEDVLLGITKAALATDSFLSAASFQETTKVLTDAAIKGKTDHLQGLKENVIIGKLIPAGTGMKRYSEVNVDYGVNTEYMESFNRKEVEKKASHAIDNSVYADDKPGDDDDNDLPDLPPETPEEMLEDAGENVPASED